jgi:RsiW-degrading membrane proteinase PrsW (M82 family)
MHGLNLSRLTRWVIGLGYAAAAIVVFNTNWANLNTIIRIPFIEYLIAFIMAGLIALGFWIADRFKKNNTQLSSTTGDD